MHISIDHNQMEEIEGISTEYPYVMHQISARSITAPWHWHEAVEFDYVSAGIMEVTTINRTYHFGENEAFFINANILCTMESADDSSHIAMDSHLFHPVLLGGHYNSIFQTKYINPVLNNKNLDILEIRGANSTQKKILSKLRAAAQLQKKVTANFRQEISFLKYGCYLCWKLKIKRKIFPIPNN